MTGRGSRKKVRGRPEKSERGLGYWGIREGNTSYFVSGFGFGFGFIWVHTFGLDYDFVKGQNDDLEVPVCVNA